MNLDGGSVEYTGEISHLQTADDLRARAAALGADMHEGIEISGMQSIFRDIPPEISSTLFPQNFRDGAELPNAATSYATFQGIYSTGRIAQEGREQFLEAHPEAKFRPDPNASLGGAFQSASNIASLVESPQHGFGGPKGPGEV